MSWDVEIPLRQDADLESAILHLGRLAGRRLEAASALLAAEVLEAGGGWLRARPGEVLVTGPEGWSPDVGVARVLAEVSVPEPGSLLLRGDAAAGCPRQAARRRAAEEVRRVQVETELEETNRGIMALHKELDDAWREAQQASLMKSEFLARMSHDIRTPINGVMGMAWLLLGSDLSDEQRDYVQAIRTSAETLLALVSDVLDLSKIEAGRIELEQVPFDLLLTMDEMADILGPGCHAKGLELLMDVLPGTPRHGLGDPVRVRQILLNLLSNAVKFTESGFVLLRMGPGPAEGWVRIEVQDTGIGIPASALPTLFDMFTQADPSTTRRYGGSGLGLAICKRLVEAMGGRLGVDSEPGRGSLFWLEMPFPRDPAAPNEAETARAGLPVLVVDELAFRREMLVHRLQGLGFEAVGAGTAEETAGLLERRAFSLVLIDGAMQVEDLSRAARARGATPALLARDPVRARALRRAGHAHVLSRPVKPSRFLSWLVEVGPGVTGSEPDPADLDLRVLLAEDNPVNRHVAMRTLEKMGCRVEVAVNGQEALEKLTSGQRWDLALMDCHMPVMDGFDVTREVRRRGVPVRIVALTALATETDRARCFEAGMDDYLVKPVSPAELREALLAWRASGGNGVPAG